MSGQEFPKFSTITAKSKNFFLFSNLVNFWKTKKIFVTKKGLNSQIMNSTPLFANTLLAAVKFFTQSRVGIYRSGKRKHLEFSTDATFSKK